MNGNVVEMVNVIIYGILSLIFSGILYYYSIRYVDEPVEEDTFNLIVSIVWGWFWPLVIMALIVVIVVKFLGLFIKWVANVCALVDGFIHGIGRDNGKNY